MTDELTPEQEADIRRLLAEARHDGPIPADVAARLDAVLGDLSADDLEVFEVASVTDLAGVRHRRRKAGRLLLAAAAVVVGGVTMGQVIGNTTGADDSADSPSSAEAGGLPEAPREGTSDQGTNDEGAAAGGDTYSDDAGEPEAPTAASSDLSDQRLLEDLNAPLELDPEDFAAQVVTNLGDAEVAREAATRRNFDGVSRYAAYSLFTCPDGDYGEGARLPAYYDEQEAVLVLRRPVGGVQRVDLLACGTAATLDSVDLPAP